MTELTGEAKRELLARLLRERAAGRANGAGAGPPQAPGLRRVDRGADLALSSGQERWWFQEQLLPESVSNMLVLLGISGPVDHEAMRRSIATVVERQESLRTVYPMVDGRPMQRIIPFDGWSLPLVDLRQHGADARRDEMRRRSRALIKAPFDLERGPLFRTEMLRLADDEYLLVSAIHHIVADAWSIEVYFDELAACYAAFTTGGVPELPILPVQYADYAQWHRELNTGKFFATQRDYWTTRLAGQLPVVEPAIDHPRSRERTFDGRALHATIAGTLLTRLRELSRREGVTLFTTLLTAFEALLLRHTGEEDLLVGTYVAGRERPEIERLIGFFVNTLALRTDLSGNPTFREALARTRDVVLGAHSHADFPFDQLIRELQPARDPGRNAVLRVFFNKLSVGRELQIEAAGVRLRLIPSFDVYAVADALTLFASEGREEVDLWFVYGTELYEEETIARMREHLETLLQEVVANPDRRLWDVPLLRGPEQARLRSLADGPVQVERGFVPFHRHFEERAASRPDAIALSSGEGRCTYEELNRRANRVAHRLRALGVGPGVLVGVCAERSFNLVAALIGIQKAGGAYVPLDPDLPVERLSFMLSDSGAGVLVSSGGMAEDLSGAALRLDLDRPETWQGVSDLDLVDSAGADDPVYVMYTSGSTGRPKGVRVPHGALANFLEAMLLSPGLSEGDVVAGVSTISFDISGLELYLPLRVGARIELVSRIDASDGVALAARLADSGVTLLQATPATWRLLLEANWRGTPGFRAFCGGEALSRELADQLLSRAAEVWNLYGPTEATIWSTVGRVTAGAEAVPVGRPIANTRIYVVDRSGNLAPLGAPGEVWIGGRGLAAGYHGRPDLTAERFVADPFSGEAGARLYRTGDRGRWRPDGALELLGRLDSQVKLRGFRIELEEIESVLGERPGVREAAAAVQHDPAGDPRLVAYVVPRVGVTLCLDEIRSGLRSRLPEYMVPSRLMLLDRLPLTHNGKLDRRALPPLDAADPVTAGESEALRSGTEAAVGAIWRSVLGVDRVGRSDNFFELGGHSLLVMRVVARLRDEFGGEISVRQMFEKQTIAEIAAYLDQRGAADRQKEPPIPRIGARSSGSLSSAQERLWFFDRLEPGSNTYNVPAAMKLSGRLDRVALQAAFDAIVMRHEALRTTFPAHEGRPVQRIHSFAPVPIPTLDLRSLPPELRDPAAQQAVLDELGPPFDLAGGPLMRVRLVCLAEERHLLIATFHHIVADGWSLGVFLRELAELYSAQVSGRSADLPELSVQYVDFASQQQDWLKSDAAGAEIEYWRRQLDGAPPALELPLDFPRPLAQSFTGGTVLRNLDRSVRDQLEAVSRSESATLFMTLLAAFDVVLGRQSGQRDICVGVPVAGRLRTETERLIGVFVNTLVFRTRLDRGESFRGLLGRVKEMAVAAFTHEELPFERLVEELQPERDLSRTPLFQVMFNMIATRGAGTLTLPGLIVEAPSITGAVEVPSKFDLTLYATDEPAGLRLAMVYNTHLFSAERMESVMDQLVRLLETVVADPGVDVMTVALAGAAAGLIPDPAIPLTRSWTEPVHARFSQHARNAPDRAAVVDATASWTYRDIDRESDRLAGYLVREGIGREDRVAIYAHRSAGLVWAMLGVLKAGAAFVIIDPAYPPARTLQCLRQTRPRGWIHLAEAGPTATPVEEYLAGIPGLVRTGRGTGSAEAWRESPAEPGTLSIGPDDLAYIVFTSGSTGVPKAIAGTHGPLSHFFDWHAGASGIGPSDRFAVLSGLGHDPLLRDILGALWAGATVCVPAAEDLESPGRLRGWLAQQAVSVVHLTPAMASHVTEGSPDGGAGLPALRLVCFGGDVLTTVTVARLRALAAGALFLNFYGASETPQAIAWYAVPSVPAALARVPVGRGIPEVQLLVLNQAGGLAGLGELGEIHVRTPHLARGYFDDPALTAARFVLNPYRSDRSDLMYRTGDLGRYRLDGTVDFAGRSDEQIKIRGYRVEPGDVEAALRGLSGVGQAAVVVWSDPGAEPRLVGYVAAADTPLESKQIREALRASLPDHMIPGQIVFLDRLPITPNGKLDRAGLPRPPARATTEPVLPRSSLEEAIATAWCEVLGCGTVGVHDNFFELGGHSLMATRVLARLESRLGRTLPVRALFESPTVAELAFRMEAIVPAREPVVALEREEVSL